MLVQLDGSLAGAGGLKWTPIHLWLLAGSLSLHALSFNGLVKASLQDEEGQSGSCKTSYG